MVPGERCQGMCLLVPKVGIGGGQAGEAEAAMFGGVARVDDWK